MEGQKQPRGSPPSSSSIADELFGRRDAAAPAKSSGEIFGSAFPVSGVSDSPRSDSRGSSRKQEGSSQGTIEAGDSRCSPTEEQSVPSKDKLHSETRDNWTSIYYGGQDDYSSSSASQSSGISRFKKDDKDDSDGSDMASRGNWWQGSLYY